MAAQIVTVMQKNKKHSYNATNNRQKKRLISSAGKHSQQSKQNCIDQLHRGLGTSLYLFLSSMRLTHANVGGEKGGSYIFSWQKDWLLSDPYQTYWSIKCFQRTCISSGVLPDDLLCSISWLSLPRQMSPCVLLQAMFKSVLQKVGELA